MNLRTANKNFKRAHRRRVRDEAYAFDVARAERPMTDAQLRRRVNSGFVRRHNARYKAWKRSGREWL